MDTKVLRQKVLDLAIRGKLVPQDPNDEPASVLLERIRQQKQQMVKDGKLNRNTAVKVFEAVFETDGDVPEAMRASALGPEAGPYLERRGPKYHVDLAGLNRQWLLRAGVAPDRIDDCGLCTACRPDLYWSHRKMGLRRGEQAALIALREDTL